MTNVGVKAVMDYKGLLDPGERGGYRKEADPIYTSSSIFCARGPATRCRGTRQKPRCTWTFVFYADGLALNVLYTVDDPKKRAVGFKLSDWSLHLACRQI